MKLDSPIKIKVIKHAFLMLNNLKQSANKDDVLSVKDGLFPMNKGILKGVWDKVMDLWSVIKSNDIPFSQKALPLAALIYTITPMDAIPDLIPFIGLSDDATIIVATAATIATTIIKSKNKSNRTVENEHMDGNTRTNPSASL